jgi:hypothetical protein
MARASISRLTSSLARSTETLEDQVKGSANPSLLEGFLESCILRQLFSGRRWWNISRSGLADGLADGLTCKTSIGPLSSPLALFRLPALILSLLDFLIDGLSDDLKDGALPAKRSLDQCEKTSVEESPEGASHIPDGRPEELRELVARKSLGRDSVAVSLPEKQSQERGVDWLKDTDGHQVVSLFEDVGFRCGLHLKLREYRIGVCASPRKERHRLRLRIVFLVV